MFWDGFVFACCCWMLMIFIFGEYRIGSFVVTDRSWFKWTMIVALTFYIVSVVFEYLL